MTTPDGRLFERKTSVGSAVRKIFSRRGSGLTTPSPSAAAPSAQAADVGAAPDPMLAAWFARVRACEERGEAAAAGDATARRHREEAAQQMSEDTMEVRALRRFSAGLQARTPARARAHNISHTSVCSCGA
eukprot:1760946-Prymnesium_polylepis.1